MNLLKPSSNKKYSRSSAVADICAPSPIGTGRGKVALSDQHACQGQGTGRVCKTELGTPVQHVVGHTAAKHDRVRKAAGNEQGVPVLADQQFGVFPVEADECVADAYQVECSRTGTQKVDFEQGRRAGAKYRTTGDPGKEA